MAANEYIGHEQPGGVTVEDRYARRGLFPECEIELSGGNYYYRGIENVAGAHVYDDVRHPGNESYWDIDSEDKLAAFLMDSWMTSEPHRQAMLVRNVDEAGLGIAITDSGEVYAALDLC
jgi:uncharacterized protein YkwD